MVKLGMVSVTLRDLSVEEVVSEVKKQGLEGIEWGGDVHVPHGDLKRAEYVGQITREAGLKVVSYGSYYKIGQEDGAFVTILETAEKLGARIIRVWAGMKSPEKFTSEEYKTLVEGIRFTATLCENSNIKLTLEYHRNTYTENIQSTLKLLKDVGHSNLYSYWQPPALSVPADNLKEIELLKDKLLNIHVFERGYNFSERYLLSENLLTWKSYINKVRTFTGDRWALLEFVKDDSIENFHKDSQTLLSL